MRLYWLIRKIIEPHPAIVDPLQQQRAKITSSILLFWLFGMPFLYLLWITTHPAFIADGRSITAAIGYLLLIPCFFLSRTRYYRIAAWINVASGILLNILGYLRAPDGIDPNVRFMFIAPALMVAAMILSLAETTLLLILTGLALAALPLLVSNPDYDAAVITSIVISIGLLSVVFAWFYQRFNQRILNSEKRYRDLLDLSTEGLLIIDRDEGRILDVNTAIERILGYSREEMLGKLPSQFVRSDYQKVVFERWRERNFDPIEAVVEHKKGFELYVEVLMRPSSYGNDPAHVLIVHDVTERRVAIEALIESEKRFAAIFNQAFQFICLLTTSGNILEINNSILRFFSLEHSDVLGQPMWEVQAFTQSKQGENRLREAIQHAADGNFIRYETVVRDRHGVKAVLDLSIMPITSEQGKPSMLIAEARDITANRLAEAHRIEHEQRYQALFEQTADAVTLVNMDRIIVSVNDQALKMFGCTRDDLIGKKADDVIVEEEINTSHETLQRIVSNQSIEPVVERRLRRMDGTTFLAEISTMLVRDADGNPQYVQSLIRDTSERNQLHQQQFELRLERERVRMLESFIEQASHHFRTPIANIKTSAYLLPRLEQTPEKQSHHLQVMQDEIIRLENLLNDLLTVTRLQKGDSALSIGLISMNQLLSEIRNTYEAHDIYNRHVWSWDIDLAIDIYGDKHHITNAITILLQNAIRYTPDGNSIQVRLFGHHSSWGVIEVKDAGMGISPTDLPHIFDNFYRSHQAQSIDSSTTGLGLSICKQIAALHSGIVRVESEVDKGTTFQIILPILGQWGEKPPPMPEGGLLIPASQSI